MLARTLPAGPVTRTFVFLGSSWASSAATQLSAPGCRAGHSTLLLITGDMGTWSVRGMPLSLTSCDQRQRRKSPVIFRLKPFVQLGPCGRTEMEHLTPHRGRGVQSPEARAAASPLSLAGTRGFPRRGGCRGARGCMYRRDETFASWGLDLLRCIA